MSRPVFVFGSNRIGVHGAGAAKFASLNYGAIRGQGEGMQGHAYGIPTKATPYVTLPLPDIRAHVDTFIAFARAHPQLQFQVTAIGTGRAGYSPMQIGPMFAQAPDNCILCPEFEPYRAVQRGNYRPSLNSPM